MIHQQQGGWLQPGAFCIAASRCHSGKDGLCSGDCRSSRVAPFLMGWGGHKCLVVVEIKPASGHLTCWQQDAGAALSCTQQMGGFGVQAGPPIPLTRSPP